MWKVLDGATTGCLKQAQNSAVNGNYNNFNFVSNLLDPRQFCEFDINGNIIEDPNKYFICNLPLAKDYAPLAITYFARVTLPNTFKNWYTTAQRTAIGDYMTAKKWNLVW